MLYPNAFCIIGFGFNADHFITTKNTCAQQKECGRDDADEARPATECWSKHPPPLPKPPRFRIRCPRNSPKCGSLCQALE